jgi:micrococcal nuclease
MTANSSDIRLTKMPGDKYFGRILANVTLAEGSDPAHNLLSEGFAHAYDGGRTPRIVSTATE